MPVSVLVLSHTLVKVCCVDERLIEIKINNNRLNSYKQLTMTVPRLKTVATIMTTVMRLYVVCPSVCNV